MHWRLLNKTQRCCMKKSIFILLLSGLLVGCAPKLGPDPLDGFVEIPKDLQQQISNEVDGDCNLINLVSSQVNIQLLNVSLEVCFHKIENDPFRLEELLECSLTSLKHHALPKKDCGDSKDGAK